jgi:oligogalacturonide lyase
VQIERDTATGVTDTGVTVRRLTETAAISHPSYFLQSSFYPGDHRLFYTSYETGLAQLFDVGYPDGGEPRQLTRGEAGIHPFSPALHPHGESLCFVRAGGIYALHLQSLAEREIYRVPGASIGECSISPDGEWLTAAAKIDGANAILCGRWDGTGWHSIPFPRTIIHPQFHPLDPEWIEFSGDPAPRMHRVRRDGTGMECLYEHRNEEFIVHETFLGQTGDIVFTVWPFALKRMNWHTREISTICERNCWHIAPNRAGTKVLCDTNHPDLGIHIVDVATGDWERVCLSAASSGGSQWRTSRYALKEDFEAARSAAKSSGLLSWMETGTDTVYGPQWTHPHPSWSRDERKIAFASDKTGVTQVYVAELGA